jgi:aspartate/methionine/tyrosine aminotransferase
MQSRQLRFRHNDIMSLTGEAPPYDLAESVGPSLTLGELFDGDGLGDLAGLRLDYGTAAGGLALRQAIAAGHGVSAEDVVVTMGGMQALFLAAFLLCEPGDEAVITAPLFPNARAALESVGATVRAIPLSFDDRYALKLDAVRQALSPRTKLVSIASPQNPSGVVTPMETIRGMLALMEEICPAAFLLIDETYREAVYGRNAIAPSAIALSPKIISCASLSKCHGAAGLRLGWAITRDAALREQFVLGKFNTVISCSPLYEALALRVLRNRETIIGERRIRLYDGLSRVARWAEENAGLAEWVRPDAGALCCVRLSPAVFDGAGIGRFHGALAKSGVRVAPGNWFGDEERVFRLGFGLLPMPELDQGLQRLSDALRLSLRDAA